MIKLGVTIIGAGWMGELHSLAFSQSPYCNIISIADIDLDKADSVTKKVGGLPLNDYKVAIDDDKVQIVSVCTPDDSHIEPVLFSIKKGKNVIVEKPITNNSIDGEKIVEALKNNSVKFMVGHLLRFDPRYIIAKESIENNEIGNIVHIYAKRNDWLSQGMDKGRTTNPVFWLGVHDIDIANWFIDSKVENVYAQSPSMALVDINSVDAVISIVRYTNGVCASFEFSWILTPTMGRPDAYMEIVGTNGSLYIDSYQGGLRIHRNNDWIIHDSMYCPTNNNRVSGDIREEIEHFINCILEDKNPKISCDEAVYAVKTAEAMIMSSKENKIIYL